MIRLSVILAWLVILMLPVSVWAKHTGTASSNPSPAMTNCPVTITISTDDLGAEVYFFSWVYYGDNISSPTDWNGCLTDKYRMTGNAGKYSITIDDLGGFYGLTDNDLATISQLGVIARNRTDQTEDLFIEVSYVPQSTYSGGSGTSSDPYKLSSADDMLLLACSPAGWGKMLYYQLTADISLSDFPGIGSTSEPFAAHFDGQGHVINQLTMSNDTFGTPTGLFNCTDGAEIVRVGVTDASVAGRTYTGIIVGQARDTHIAQCFTTGTVESDGVCMGGIAGTLDGASTIEDCYSTAEIHGSQSTARGGITGRNGAAIRRTWSMSTVQGLDFCGSVAGANYGAIDASAALSSVIASEGDFAGRFAGNISDTRCQNTYSWANSMASGAFGYHADDHNFDMTRQDFYQSTLLWDFDNIWQWVDADGKQFALLRGLRAQTIPQNENFFNEQITGISNISGDNRINISVTDSSITTDKDCSLSIYTLTGVSIMHRMIRHGSPVSIAGLHPGVYIVQLSDGASDVTTLKIVKK